MIVVVATLFTGCAWHLLRGKCSPRRGEHFSARLTLGRSTSFLREFAKFRALEQETLQKCDQCKLPLQGTTTSSSISLRTSRKCRPGSVGSGSKASSGMLFMLPLWKRSFYNKIKKRCHPDGNRPDQALAKTSWRLKENHSA